MTVQPTGRAERVVVVGATLALIPARGGSKGLPGKNLERIEGRSLVARAVDVAVAVDAIDAVVVSSDDDAILDEAHRAGAEASRRPPELATDHAVTIDVVLHELARRPEVGTVVLLQPTSPLRTVDDVRACLAVHEPAHPVVTVTALGHPPSWTFRLDGSGGLQPLAGWEELAPRRQDDAEHYRLNGAVYVASRDHLAQHRSFVGPATRGVVMPGERSVDVDSRVDLALARLLAAPPPL